MTKFWPLALFAACAPAVSSSSSGLAGLLPTALEGLTPSGESDQAEGNDLFRLINGGAELYLEHGFQRAIQQEYETPDGVQFTLEIFEMKDPAGASAVYTAKGGTRDTPDPMGDGSTFEEYYGLYLAGRYHFSVTASTTRGELRPPIEQIARAVVAGLP